MGQKKGSKKFMPIKVHMPLTDETFKVNFVEPSTKIKILRGYLELATGIPVDIQNVHYLDESDLIDTSDVKNNDIVAGAVLTMEIWNTWKDLVEASIIGDPDWLFRLGVTKGTTFQTPNSEYMNPKNKQNWVQHRADVALMIAAHRGHANVCKKLIEWGANVNSVTPLGRTPLHFSATQDHGAVINLLLTSGADIDICDNDNNNALALANMFGHKGCERHLFLFRWQQRAKASKPKYLNPPSMAFQRCDSLYPKWKQGPVAQVYIQKLVPPGEFVGTSLHAPRRTWHRKSSAPPHLAPMESEKHYQANVDKRKKPNTFDEWVKRKTQEETVQKTVQRQKELTEIEEEKEKERIKLETEKATKARSSKRGVSSARADLVASRTPASPLFGPGGIGSGFGGGSFEMSIGVGHTLPSLQERIDALMKKHGVSAEDEPVETTTTYERWLNKRVKNEGLVQGQQLPYQLMIKEFCQQNCCSGLRSHHCYH